MEFIAADVVALGIGAFFVAVIVIAAAAFYLHVRLLERGVVRYQAELRAQRAQAAATMAVAADRPRTVRLRLVPSHGSWAETRQASAAADKTEEPVAPPRVAAR